METSTKVSGQGHYAHRLLFGQDGKLWISSGERQKFDPAQNMQSNLGKILRLNEDGTPATGNPFSDQGEIAKQVWSLGHRAQPNYGVTRARWRKWDRKAGMN